MISGHKILISVYAGIQTDSGIKVHQQMYATVFTRLASSSSVGIISKQED